MVQYWIVPKLLNGVGMDQENKRIIFLAQNVDFNHMSFDLLGSRSPPYGERKFA